MKEWSKKKKIGMHYRFSPLLAFMKYVIILGRPHGQELRAAPS